VGVRSQGDAGTASQTEISHLDDAVAVDQEILRLEVTMEDPPLVAEQQGLQQLYRGNEQKEDYSTPNLHLKIDSKQIKKINIEQVFITHLKAVRLDDLRFHAKVLWKAVHVLLEIHGEKLEDEEQLTLLHEHVLQPVK
jgi:hypothetical protein